MVKVGILGAQSAVGAELVRLLIYHPSAEPAALHSDDPALSGKRYSEVHNAFYGFCDVPFCSENEVLEKCDVIISALSSGLSKDFLISCIKNDKLVIDMNHKSPFKKLFSDNEWSEFVAYGFPEFFRNSIKNKKVLFFPSSIALLSTIALAPVLRSHCIRSSPLSINVESALTEFDSQSLTHTDTPDFLSSNLLAQSSINETEHILSLAATLPVKTTLISKTTSSARFSCAVCCAQIAPGISESDIRSSYENSYANEYFIRTLPAGRTASVRNVLTSNFCDISLHIDSHAGSLVVIAAIDNLVKGTAGQAVQCMNILLGLPETSGLEWVPLSVF